MALGNVVYTPKKPLTSSDIVDNLISDAPDLPASARTVKLLADRTQAAEGRLDQTEGWFSKKIYLDNVAYLWYVIPLIEIDNAPAWRNSFFAGNLIGVRDNGLFDPTECKVICQKQYNYCRCGYLFQHTTFSSTLSDVQATTFLYNSKRYFGLLYKQPGAMFNWFYINGNISDASIPRFIPVHDTQNNTILNPEIYNSLDNSETFMINSIKFVE